MNKTQLVEAIALDTNQSKVEVRKTLDALIRVMNQALREEDRITLSGLGSFAVQHQAERMVATRARGLRYRFRLIAVLNSAPSSSWINLLR